MNTFSLRHAALAAGVLGYAAFAAADLPVTWLHSPADHCGWLPFCAWLAGPTIRLKWTHLARARWLATALALSVLGTIVSLNAVQHLGLAVAIASFLPDGRRRLAWLCGAACWLPAFGWALGFLHPTTLFLARLALAAAASAVWWPWRPLPRPLSA